MGKGQYLAIGAVLILFLVLYFACETKPPGQSQVERTRVLQAEATDVTLLMREAHDELSGEQLSLIQTLQAELQTAPTDSAKVELLERLSGEWYRSGHPAIAGHYAQEIAELQPSADTWSIAGTTYVLCVQKNTEQKVRTFCQQRAITALENAISLEPEQAEYQVNLALLFTEMPPEGNPMKGVLMLRELEEAFPESTLVLNSLARLAIKTNQFGRAIERLTQSLALEANNRNALCLMAMAQSGAGNATEATAYEARCQASADQQ